MKNYIRSFLSLFGLALLAAAVSAHAQNTQTIQAKVPFPFVVAGQALPPAEYRLQITQFTGLVVISSDGINRASLLTNRDYRPKEASEAYLRFRRFGDHWVLREVAQGGVTQMITITKSDQVVANLQPSDQQTLMASSVVGH